MLDACDEVGMLVMDETFDMWTEAKTHYDYSLSFPEWWERDAEAMVHKDFNHPSVVLYCIGNEILETGRPVGSTWGRKLAEKIRSIDDTRYVTNAINNLLAVLPDVTKQRGKDAPPLNLNEMMGAGGLNDEMVVSDLVTEKTAESYGVLDIAGMNYSDARYETDRDVFPNRIIVGTETFPTRIDSNWKLVKENSHVLGDFTWTGWEYLGEAGIGRVDHPDENYTPTGPVGVRADRSSIRADTSGLAFVDITLEDENGAVATHLDRPVTVRVEGAGVLQGLGSAKPNTEERFDAATHTTFDGRALAIIRPIADGAIDVTVSAEGCEDVTITVEAHAVTREAEEAIH